MKKLAKYRYNFNPESDSTLSLMLDGILYDIDMLWLDVLSSWLVSISTNGVPITSGRVAIIDKDLLGNVIGTGFLRFEGRIPTRDNIGKSCFLYYTEVGDAA